MLDTGHLYGYTDGVINCASLSFAVMPCEEAFQKRTNPIFHPMRLPHIPRHQKWHHWGALGAKRTNWKGGAGSKGRTEHAGNIKKPFFFSPQPSKSRAFLKFCVKHPKTISSKFGALSKCSHSGQFWRSVAITTTQSYGKSPRHLIDLFFGSSNSQREVSGKDKMTNRLSTNLPSGNLRYLK